MAAGAELASKKEGFGTCCACSTRNGLDPFVGVCANNSLAEETGHDGGAAGRRKVARWINGDGTPPGRVTPGKPPADGAGHRAWRGRAPSSALPPAPISRDAADGVGHRAGEGRQGRPLIVLGRTGSGEYATVTLQVQTDGSVVLYDGGNAASQRSARRLTGMSSELPCGGMCFQPSAVVGRGFAAGRVRGRSVLVRLRLAL